MHVDSYKFGRITIDGASYSNDVIILKSRVRANWWRKEGHMLSAEDLDDVVEVKPQVLVVGCGAYSVMEISDRAREVLEQNAIKLEAMDTAQAVRRFNELSEAGAQVAAALHLTC